MSTLYDTPRREAPPADGADLAGGARPAREDPAPPRSDRRRLGLPRHRTLGQAASAPRPAPPGAGRSSHRPARVRAAGRRHAVGGRRGDRPASARADELGGPASPLRGGRRAAPGADPPVDRSTPVPSTSCCRPTATGWSMSSSSSAAGGPSAFRSPNRRARRPSGRRIAQGDGRDAPGRRRRLVSFLSSWRLILLIGPLVLLAAYVMVQRSRSKTAIRFTSVEMLASVAPRRPGWQRHIPAAALARGRRVAGDRFRAAGLWRCARRASRPP